MDQEEVEEEEEKDGKAIPHESIAASTTSSSSKNVPSTGSTPRLPQTDFEADCQICGVKPDSYSSSHGRESFFAHKFIFIIHQ